MLSERPRQYQPTITRLPFLVILFSLTLALIALTELACRRLPPRNSKALAVLDLKRSRDLTPRDIAAPHESAYLRLGPSAAVSTLVSIAPSAIESVDLPSGSSLVGALESSKNIPAQTSIDAPAQTSIDAPAQTSIDAPAQTSIDVPVESPTATGIPAQISIPTSAAESVNLPLEPSVSRFLQGPSSQTADDQDATAAGSTYLPKEQKLAPVESDYLPLVPTTTPYNSPLKPGHPVPSEFLPLSPTTVSASADAPLKSTVIETQAAHPSDYLPLGPTATYSTPDESDYLPLMPTLFIVSFSAQTSLLPPDSILTDSFPQSQSYPATSVYLPLNPTKPAESLDAVFGQESDYLPLEPTATYSTPDGSEYLPLEPTVSLVPFPGQTDFLPLDPILTGSFPRPQSYPATSVYLPLHPTKPAGSDDVVFGDESDYLPLGPIATVEPIPLSSEYLPLDPLVTSHPLISKSRDSLAFLPTSGYLPLAPNSRSQQYLAPSAYLPLGPDDGPATADATSYASKPPSPAPPAKSAYLPLEPTHVSVENTKLPDFPAEVESGANKAAPTITQAPASIPAASAFLPLQPIPLPDASAYLPLAGDSAYLALRPGKSSADPSLGPPGLVILPFPPQNTNSGPAPAQSNLATAKDQLKGQGTRIGGALPLAVGSADALPLPNLSPNQPTRTAYVGPIGALSSDAYLSDQSKTADGFINPPAQTGVFEGETYSVGANGVIIIGGKTFDRSSPTTAVLNNGKTIEAGPDGIAVFAATDALLPSKTFAQPSARTGVFQGETYSIGADGAVVIDDKTFDRSSPTTAVLGNGKAIEIGPSGIAIFAATDALLPSKTFAQPPARTGVFQGETYSIGADGAVIIGGKTFDRSSPTTAILGNGKTIEIGPSGIAIFAAKDALLPSKTFAQPSARTGVFQGEGYSVGANGVIVIGGKTFDRSSPTTAVLRNGKTVEVNPSGIAIFAAKTALLQPKIFAQPPVPTGVFQGETYSVGANGVIIIGGKTFDSSSPTTAVLPNGKTVEVSPSGIAILPADDPPAQTTALAELAGAFPITGIFQGEAYSAGADGVIVIGGKTFDRFSPTTAVLDSGKTVEIGPSGVAILAAQDPGPGPERHYIPPNEYVLGAFVPVIVAVVFTIPWQILNAAVKEIEPFYQLQREDGVTAADSLALEYRSSINIIATFTAIRKGHFLVWWSGLISIVALTLAPLATETVFIGFQGRCTPDSGREACIPQLNVYPVAARVLQGILSFMAILTLALAYSLHRGKTGLHANALSIAGLAALFQNKQVVEDFRRLNPHYTTSKMISSALRDNRYRIAAFFEEDGTSAYGLVKCNHDSALMDPNYRVLFRRGKKYASVNVTAIEDQERPKKHRTFSSYFTHPAAIVAFAAFVAGLETLVIYYNQTSGDTAFERWMDSQTFGVGFLFTAVGVLIKMYWGHLDDGLRNMEPYRRLLTGAVRASDSILLAPHSNPFTGLVYSLRNRHFFNAYISLVAILCLPLIVALASIPYKAALAWMAYRSSTYISIGILSMMLIGIVWHLCRGRTPDLVRRPDTIASVLLFICGSSMREDFKGMSLMRRRERDDVVTRWGKSFAMGNVVGVDGVERQAVDESVFVTGELK